MIELDTYVDRLQFSVLGPLEIIRNGRNCTPRALKQRILLALLLLNANKLVTTDAIIDEMWGARPPRSAQAAIQMYVSGVRRSLVQCAGVGDPRKHPTLKTAPSGYLLVVRPSQLDLLQFRTHVARGRELLGGARCEDAAGEFRLALSLWRGRALADLARWPECHRHAAYLEEERLSALESRIDVDLNHGPVPGLIAELEQLCSSHPYREHFHHQLMVAYYQSDRRVEALDAYARARRILREEIGIEPGPALRATQQAILGGHDDANVPHICRPAVGA